MPVSTLPLPIGCSWQPITPRLTMLDLLNDHAALMVSLRTSDQAAHSKTMQLLGAISDSSYTSTSFGDGR